MSVSHNQQGKYEIRSCNCNACLDDLGLNLAWNTPFKCFSMGPFLESPRKFSGLTPFLRPWQTRAHCCVHIVADTNASPFVRARNISCAHKFCVRDTKMFLFLFRNILCLQQMFPSLRSPRNIMGNNVSATMCPRLPEPLVNLSWSFKQRDAS